MPYALTIVMPAFNEEGNIDRQDPALRRFVSEVFNGLSSLVFGMSVRDLNCSFKLFRREVLAGLELVSNDFLVDTELVARVHRGGWRYVQKGVRHYPRTAGQSTVRPGDVPRTLASLARPYFQLRAAHPSRTRAFASKPPDSELKRLGHRLPVPEVAVRLSGSRISRLLLDATLEP